MSTKRIKMNDGAFIEDEKKPAKLSVVVSKTDKAGFFRVEIVHPNRQKDLSREVLYSEEHEANNIVEAIEIGNKIKELQFSNVVTVYEDIKFIPNYKRGKMKLHTMDIEEVVELNSDAKKILSKLQKDDSEINLINKEKKKKTTPKKNKK